jgi:hypothetical protein
LEPVVKKTPVIDPKTGEETGAVTEERIKYPVIKDGKDTGETRDGRSYGPRDPKNCGKYEPKE